MTTVLIVVSAAKQSDANQAALQWDPEGGLQTWTVGLNASGRIQDPVTHYWASWPCDDTQLAQVAAVVDTLGLTMFQNAADPDVAIGTLGLMRIDPYST